VISKIIEAIESIRSYGIKGGKRIFVGYDSEKKVVNRSKKSEKEENISMRRTMNT